MQIKQWFFIGIFFFFSISSQAQGFHFGVRAGVDMINSKASVPVNSFVVNHKSAMSFNVNALLGYQLNDQWSITIEPGFIRKGWKEVYVDKDKVIDFNYWQVPVLVEYHITDKFGIAAGPDFGFYSKRSKYDLWNSFELSGVLGLNYSLTEHVSTQLRFGYALTPSMSANATDVDGKTVGDYTEHTNYLQLSLAYRL